MSRRQVLRILLLLTLLLGLTNQAAAASPVPAAPPSAITVGGPQLADPGTVVESAPGVPPLPALASSGWIVADADTGDVLAAHDAHGKFLPASTLKTLTAVTLIPRLDLNRRVQPTTHDLTPEQSNETLVGLAPGMSYTIDQLFTYLLVDSGNDAARTLESAAGGRDAAMRIMNDEARRLGATDTTARNAAGLDAEGQVSSPYDLALIAREGLRLPDFRRYVATRSAKVPRPSGPPFEIQNHNRVLYNVPGAIGVKNGYTIAAQATDIGAATRDGHTLIVVLMHAPARFWPEAGALLDWGFAARGKVRPVGRLVGPGEASESAQARGGDAATGHPGAVTAQHWWHSKLFWAAGGVALLVLYLVYQERVYQQQMHAGRRRR